MEISGPVVPSFRALAGRPELTVRRHQFNNDSLLRASHGGTLRRPPGSGTADGGGAYRFHPGVELRANVKSISHRCRLFELAFVWELTKATIHLPLGCLQGGVQPSDISFEINVSAQDAASDPMPQILPSTNWGREVI